ncbi:MAG: hypothetical protein ACRBN8_05440 [Nannocystales bacterium]
MALAAFLLAPACKGDRGAGASPIGSAAPGETEGVADEAAKLAIPDEGPLPKLRTGARELETADAVVAEMAAHAERGAHYYAVVLPNSARALADGEAVRLHIETPAVAVGVVHRSQGATEALVRVPATAGPAPEITGTVYVVGSSGRGNWTAVPFSAKGAAKESNDADLPRRWAEAFGQQRRGDRVRWWMDRSSHPWNEFAAGRVWSAVTGTSRGEGVSTGAPTLPRRTELSELMHTTTAATSMQEALQHDRGLRLRATPGPANVPLSQLEGPELEEHPWAEMTAALPNPTGGIAEPLAADAPADFWYVRFDDIRVFLQVLDEADTWITPVAHVMEERGEVRGLAKRYQAQLGLRRTGLAKRLGHTVVERVAVVGSDPYLREGSDVTFMFALNNATVFNTELGRHMSAYESEVPGIVKTQLVHGSHTITVHRDPAGVVRQHRALVDNVALVSNSEGAIRAVLDAADGKRPRLSDEADLGYMLARDPGQHQGFAFLSDRFIAKVVGPEQKVLASRRQRALADLLTPGYSALLYGWLEGKAPADTEALIASHLLDREELSHAGGETIAFTPGTGARSSWGSPAALTPLIDLPRPTMVTEAERIAYGGFIRGYQNYWRSFIDPVAIRLDLEGEPGAEQAVVDVRVLPLISGTQYSDIEEIVGTERVEVPAIDDGLQMVWAVGEDSSVRRDLDRAASSLTGNKDIGLGWLGEWVMVGSLDRHAVVEMLVEVDEDIQLPKPESDEQGGGRAEDLEIVQKIGRLPVYAAAHVRNPASLIMVLTAIRGMVNEVAPGMVLWGEDSRYRDYSIVRVGINPKAPGEFGGFADAIALYYVQAGESIVFALRPKVLEALVDRIVDGGGPRPGAEDGPQFVVDARLAKNRASWTAAAWALQGQANRSQGSSRAAAEILLRGDPSLRTPEQLVERGLAYFGSHPVSASGGSEFELSPAGVSDPIHGSEVVPSFPELPVAGSPIDALMQRLVGLQASVAFDREPAKLDPPARSLHTHFRVHLGQR